MTAVVTPAPTRSLTKGAFLTDEARLVEVKSVRKVGIFYEDSATGVEGVIELEDLKDWRVVEQLPLEGS